MENNKTLICYSSVTGNTRKIAEKIYEACPFPVDIIALDNLENVPDAGNYGLLIVGYWVENSKANNTAISYLKTLTKKKLILFGTAGTDVNHPYIKSVLKNTESELDKSNELLGHFICQGEIAEKVISDFELIVELQPDNKMLSALLKIFREQLPVSKGHPDKTDIQNAEDYFRTLFNTLK